MRLKVEAMSVRRYDEPRRHDGRDEEWWVAIVRTLACVAVVAVAIAVLRAELPREIRVVTYNIHHGEGMDRKFDLERIAKVMMAEKPDIVALAGSGSGDEAGERRRSAGGVCAADRDEGRCSGGTSTFDGGGYGTAVLTKLPIRSSESVKLKSFYESTPEHKEQRGVQVLELGEKDGPGLLFLCTHLDFRPPDDERMNSAKTINELIQEARRGAGDYRGGFQCDAGEPADSRVREGVEDRGLGMGRKLSRKRMAAQAGRNRQTDSYVSGG